MELNGKEVELHFESTERDDEDLCQLRLRSEKRWSQPSVDGWTQSRVADPLPTKGQDDGRQTV
jgi:hypothetical protein